MDSTSKSTESIPDLFQLQMQCTGLTTALRGENDKPSDNSYILHNYNINKSYQLQTNHYYKHSVNIAHSIKTLKTSIPI